MKPNPEFVRMARAMYDNATERIVQARSVMEEAGRERALALGLLHDHGLSYTEIAAMVGISAPRVGQLITGLAQEAEEPTTKAVTG